MAPRAQRLDVGVWGKTRIAPGERKNVEIVISESYSGANIKIPIHVRRAARPGPTGFVTAAVHGDELNGTGAIRRLILEADFELTAGSLILVPVVNILGFERHSRYLPDRRDLNRSFPGSPSGSLASRLASVITREIIRRSDFGIDLHTAAIRRTNFPNVRADMGDETVAELARSFGAELILQGQGPRGSLRRSACKAGVPTIILEAGEVWKVEPSVVDYAIRGIRNVLAHRGMIDQTPEMPAHSTVPDKTTWVRAPRGGFLRFHVAPGDLVEKSQPIATATSLVGRDQEVIESPASGIILGMTTIPAVAPGDPIVHIAYRKDGTMGRIERAAGTETADDLLDRIRADLAAKVMVWPYEAEAAPLTDQEQAI